jgi:hypothetical protein
MFREDFINGVIDYRWLLDRNYPQRSAIHLVGDRYKLTGAERSMLYRGVSGSLSSERRYAKITGDPGGGKIAVDCHNVLFTIAHYLLGKPVYISDDGLLRDAGEGKGRIHNKKIFEKALKLLKASILHFAKNEYILLMDAPISNSGRLAAELSSFLNLSGIKGNAEALNSPDHILQELRNVVICSSDSAILDKTSCKVFDLPFFILDKNYSPEFISIRSIFHQKTE